MELIMTFGVDYEVGYEVSTFENLEDLTYKMVRAYDDYFGKNKITVRTYNDILSDFVESSKAFIKNYGLDEFHFAERLFNVRAIEKCPHCYLNIIHSMYVIAEFNYNETEYNKEN